MTSTAHLLRTVGDQQLRGKHPNVWPARTLTFQQRKWMTVWVREESGVMSVCVLYASMEGEPWNFVVFFGLN